MPTKEKTLLEISNLKTNFHTYEGVVKALGGVNLRMNEGETLGVVGETGCGKSVTVFSILKLISTPPGEIVDGQVFFEGKDLLKINENEMRKIRGGKISMIFQQPTTSLNPVFKIGDQIAEAIELHRDLSSDALEVKIERLTARKNQLKGIGLDFISKIVRLDNQIAHAKSENTLKNPSEQTKEDKHTAAFRKAVRMLDLVGVPDPNRIANEYPHQLSGGMQQRVMIAMALVSEPVLLIADEPTTSLDVTIQAQILELMKDLRKKLGMSIMLITHNLGLVAEMCDKVAVMYAGQVVEYADMRTMFKDMKHPYTKGLLKAIPKITEKQDRLYSLAGSVPNLINPPTGCVFHPRCEYIIGDICRNKKPEPIEVGKGHLVSCFLFGKEEEA
jgi:oligopeptide/dipeptide ABC transporter ATP-binding protein